MKKQENGQKIIEKKSMLIKEKIISKTKKNLKIYLLKIMKSLKKK